MSLKNKVYIILSFILVIFMIFLTFLYLSSHKKETTTVLNTSSSSSITSKGVVSTSSAKVVEKKSEEKEMKQSKETASSSEEVKSNDKDNHEYTSNYRYVYEAVGGDDFSVVSKLTGVDVDTLAKANSLSKDVIFKKGDCIFVP